MRLFDYLTEAEQLEKWREYVNGIRMLKAAVEILEKLESKGYSAFIVGGTVRDLVLGDTPHDIDIATNCPIEEIETMFPSHDIGKNKEFGIVVIKHRGFDFEVANYRKDGKYLDGRRPERVEIVLDLMTDVSRRDFTVNAMGIDKDGNIIDYFDGQRDIKNKILRTVGNPHERFGEDFLRMMRAARFSAKLDFFIHPETKAAAKDLAANILKLAPERIKDEIFKAASQTGDKFAKYLVELDDMGILELILPEITKLKEFKHSAENHPEGAYVRRILK